eukprot:CAMPEP_0202905448 /NCGR_PEP_ID=MMETSP1392-20130828/34279_1 /ASSEMBLY_ACC=CAM_ASM_000868 /TAXON_ID=225041 /ORGANISM="Chlamydomonas chlamydogama, Strain SAG 11-48b" /LENGTH=403 /DNA_ID=CAMNT_0049593527 /DNA_START=121 /DNA_END=1332 /DNA_ORIENTATION=-
MDEQSNFVKLKSGKLQDLFHLLQHSTHAVTIDLHKQTFSGKASGLNVSVESGSRTLYDKTCIVKTANITIQNGSIELGNYGLLITAPGFRLSKVQLYGQGPAWRRGATKAMMRVCGEGRVTIEDSVLVSTSEDPSHTMAVEHGGHVDIVSSTIRHKQHALGVKVRGGSLRAVGSEFGGDHENIIVSSEPSKPRASRTSNSISQHQVLEDQAADQAAAAEPAAESALESVFSVVELEGCELSGDLGGMSNVSVVGPRSSLSAARCRFTQGAVPLLASKGAQVALTECEVAGSLLAGVCCSGGSQLQAQSCSFHSHAKDCVSCERGSAALLHRCRLQTVTATPLEVTRNVQLPHGGVARGKQSLIRAVDCEFEGFGVEALVGEAGGVVVREDGIAAAFEGIEMDA